MEELKGIKLGDKRLNDRAPHILQAFASQPTASIPAACKGWNETLATYRFFQNPYVTQDKLISPHTTATINRIRECNTVLLLQDTSELDYTDKRNKIQGIGPLNWENRQGMFIHPLVAVTPEQLCLGVIDCQIWSRDPDELGQSKNRKNKPIEDKESHKWIEGCRKARDVALQVPDTKVIIVADREADMYDLFQEVADYKTENLHWIVRGQYNRTIKEKAPGRKCYQHLFDKVSSAPVLGEVEFKLSSQNGRKVHQTLRVARLTLRAPYRKYEKLTPQTITILYAHEENPPPGQEAVSWYLLSDMEISSFEEAAQMLQFYLCRWQIEIFFKVLKSGCKVEDLQLEDSQRIASCLIFYAIIAWRVMFLTMLGRECPDMPCSAVFEDCEWQVAYVVATRKVPPKDPPPLNVMIKIIAGFGGYLGRKCDGPPGVVAMWTGIQRLRDFVLGHQSMSAVK